MAVSATRAVKIAIFGGAVIPFVGFNRKLFAQTQDPEERPRKYMRACDIPMHPVTSKQKEAEEKPVVSQGNGGNVFKEGVTSVRKFCSDLYSDVKDTYNYVSDNTKIGVEHTRSSIHSLQTNPGELPRIGFISLASLGGMVVAYRGGAVKKLLFMCVSGSSAAALCYPSYTVDLSKAVTEDAKALWKENIGWPLTETSLFDRTIGSAMPMSYTGQEEEEDEGQSNPEDKDLYSRRNS